MGVLKYKILRDLWGHKARTLQVVLIIGIGAAALGMILTTRALVVPGMADMWREINPAMINLYVYPPLTEDELLVLKKSDGVEDVEGLSQTTIEWRLSSEDEWKPATLEARPDYENQRLTKLGLVSGDWPDSRVMAVGSDAESFFGIPRSGEVYLRVNEREIKVGLGGMVYNQLAQPAFMGGNAQFYASSEFYERLVGNSNFNQLFVTAPIWDEVAVTELADRLQAKLERQGHDSWRMITDPNKHFFQDQMDGFFMVLTVLGGLSLALGLLLVYNTVNALITQQVDEIGVLKAVGAHSGQVLRLYLSTVLIYGFLALLLALPLGVVGGWAISTWLADSFGADLGDFDVSATALTSMALITLVAPVLASLIPVFSGARTTVREAISTYGLNTNVGWIERLLASAKHSSRMLLLTVSNTFRNKGRVLLMQVTLVLSGLIFMMVISVRDSVIYTVSDVLFAILGADATFVFERAERIQKIEGLTLAHPEVKTVEAWGLLNAEIRQADQEYSEDDDDTLLLGVPLPTQLYGYQLREGRWLDPADSYAIVLNQELAEDVGVGVGDWVTIRYNDKKERDWHVVGLIFDPVLTNSANVPREMLLHDLNAVGRTGTIWVDTVHNDPQRQVQAARNLREYFEANHVPVSPQRGIFGLGGDSSVETAQALIGQFNFIVILLAVMAVVIGLVGSIALSGALSLSVMERRREIGVMRAIGASSWSVFRLFIGEGLLLGWLSWLIALPLSMPAGRAMVYALGQAFDLELIYHYSPTGAVLWLGIITVLSILASLLPARGATRVSVQTSLAYQ
jgi:putative ABC transport system permease protein